MFCRSWRHTLSDNQEAGHGVIGAKIGEQQDASKGPWGESGPEGFSVFQTFFEIEALGCIKSRMATHKR